MIHFSEIVGDCSGTVARGSFIPPPQTPYGILRLLEDKYRMQIEMTVNHNMYSPPMISMEINMSEDSLKQFCDDIHTSLTSPGAVPIYMNGDLYGAATPHTTPLKAWMRQVITEPLIAEPTVDDGRPCIKCTAEQKEKFIQMIERYCDTCFLGDCEAEDADDCRKCLERRVRWETDGNIFKP